MQALGFGGVVMAAAVLFLIGPPNRVTPPPPPATLTPPPGPATVSDGRLTLTSATLEPPEDASHFPAGPGAELVEAQCTTCHSASMALVQPRLDEARWSGIVEKMRTVYKAPVADADVAPIAAYLARMQQTPAAP